jgi:hypothetical protein
MTSELLTMTSELSGLAGSVAAGYESRDLDHVRGCLEGIRDKALQVESIVDGDALTRSQSGAPSWLTARSAETLLDEASKSQVDWDMVGATLSFLQTGIADLSQSLTGSS